MYNIVIISCVAPPETVVSGRINWDIADFLAKNGNKVTLISPVPSRPIGNFKDEGAFDKMLKNGVRHIRVDSFKFPNRGLFGRFYESFSFAKKAIRVVNKLDCDIIYSMPWPFIGQFLINIFINKKIKIIMNVQDLYPESFIDKMQLGILSKLFSPLKLIDKFSAKKSFHITVVSKSLKNFYINYRGIKSNKITIIENWQDEKPFIDGPKTSFIKLLKKYNFNDFEKKTIYMYLGNIGPVAGVDSLIKDFENLKNKNSVLIIAGSGTYLNKCIEYVNKNKIENVFFRSVPPGLNSVVELQSISDIMILPINKGLASSSIPSKLIAYMFSSKPILSNADIDSFTSNAIVDSNSGWITDNFTKWIDKFENNNVNKKVELEIKGKNGFNYAIQNYSRSKGLEKINHLFSQIITNSK